MLTHSLSLRKKYIGWILLALFLTVILLLSRSTNEVHRRRLACHIEKGILEIVGENVNTNKDGVKVIFPADGSHDGVKFWKCKASHTKEASIRCPNHRRFMVIFTYEVGLNSRMRNQRIGMAYYKNDAGTPKLKGMRRLDNSGLTLSRQGCATVEAGNVDTLRESLLVTSPRNRSNPSVDPWDDRMLTFENSVIRDAFEEVIEEWVHVTAPGPKPGRRRMPELKPWHRRLPVMERLLEEIIRAQ